MSEVIWASDIPEHVADVCGGVGYVTDTAGDYWVVFLAAGENVEPGLILTRVKDKTMIDSRDPEEQLVAHHVVPARTWSRRMKVKSPILRRLARENGERAASRPDRFIMRALDARYGGRGRNNATHTSN